MSDEDEDECVPNDADCSFCREIKECKVHEKTKQKVKKMRMVRGGIQVQDATKRQRKYAKRMQPKLSGTDPK